MLCPAKINLGLEVHHRRPSDGYHYLSSIFVPVDFGDEMTITPSPDGDDHLTTINELPEAVRSDFDAVSERADGEALRKNLVWKALASTRPYRDPLAVKLIKRVPTGGGLGGGSSDAGMVLSHVRDHFGLAGAEAHRIALTLGADVPFFLVRRPALVTGIGDIIEAIDVGPMFGVLCFPMLKIDTPAAYSVLKRTLQGSAPPKTLSGLSGGVRRALEASDWRAVRVLENDFEDPVFAMHGSLLEVKEKFLEHGALFASLTGSGSSLYGLVDSPERRADLRSAMQRAFPVFEFREFSEYASPTAGPSSG